MSALLVVDNPKRWPLTIPGVEVISSGAYLTERRYSDMRAAKVFNLCRSYRYQTGGYYVSLLAEARGHRPMPSISTLQDLRSRWRLAPRLKEATPQRFASDAPPASPSR